LQQELADRREFQLWEATQDIVVFGEELHERDAQILKLQQEVAEYGGYGESQMWEATQEFVMFREELYERDAQMLRGEEMQQQEELMLRQKAWESEMEVAVLKKELCQRDAQIKPVYERIQPPLWGHANNGVPDIVLTSFAREGDKSGESAKVQKEVQAWVDCEKLHKIYETGDERCSGDNGWVMLCASVHAQFWDIMKETKKTGHDLLRRRHAQGMADPVRLGLRCRHSKHRSRACLHVARACFEKDGYIVHIYHAMPERTCGCPTHCRFLSAHDMDERCKDGSAAIKLGLRYWAK
jgi:hypothetical protein